jgi:hypothetical protein
LAGLLLVTWTLAAFGEELDHERVLFAAGTETESVQVTTAELFWDERWPSCR